MNTLRIIFMGTPEFAVPSLDILLKHDYNVVAVITAPDKPAGRGMMPHQSAVKKFAVEKGLKILQPEKLKDEIFINELKSLQPDLQVVVAFRMLPEIVWRLPSRGTFNLHASLLPQYRGAAPINRAIMNGEKETGLTTFFLRHEIDTGKIIFHEKIRIAETQTAGELHDVMKERGAALVLKTVQSIETGDVPQFDQHETAVLKKAPKIFKEDCRINWNNEAETIYNQIRGLSPYPAAFTMMNGKMLKIFSANKILEPHSLKPGSISTDGKSFFRFAASNGFIEVLEMQSEGRKRMTSDQFLRGFRTSFNNE